jgi:hypothetical protein
MSSVEQTEQEHGVLAAELAAALAAAKVEQRDRGTERLARHYAELIDNAAPSRSYAKSIRVLGTFIEDNADILGHGSPRERELMEAWDKASSALAEHSVASDLGPKLLAAMIALQLTPASRVPKSGAAPAAAEQAAPDEATDAAVLRLIRGEAAQRNAGA